MRSSSWTALFIVFIVVAFAIASNNTVVVTTLAKQGSTGLRGDVRLVEGSNVSITQDASQSTITIAVSGIARGSATITAGNTSVTVSHGLSSAPSAVVLTPRSDPGTTYWVSARDATTFTITIGAAQASDVTFDWIAME